MRSLLRILDANLNRAREALRVVEDLARFHRDDAAAAASLKDARHAIDRLARPLSSELLRARDSERDVGRNGDRPVDRARSPRELREAHRRRFELYALEKRLGDPRRLLDAAQLYVLLDPTVTARSLATVAAEAVRGGADVLQLRQKPRPDAGLAREIRAACGDALFIVNDDVAVALASGADGVHLGLGDLPIAEARRLGVGIIGATSHSLAEAKRAKAAGADYVSCGPMYATPLKPGLDPKGFTYLAGLKKLGLPFFCIGGLTKENVRPALLRVAVCSGVIAAKDVAGAARSIRARLRSSSGASSRARRGTG